MSVEGRTQASSLVLRANPWLYLPLAVNLIILLLSIVRSIPMYSGDQWGNAYIVACVAALFALATPAALLIVRDRYVGTGLAITAIVIQALLLVLIFATIYSGNGYHYAGPIEPDPEPTMWQAIYFSVVTWTTLGYGDYQPTIELQVLAGLQAFLGVVFFGLTVGLWVSEIVQRR